MSIWGVFYSDRRSFENKESGARGETDKADDQNIITQRRLPTRPSELKL